MNKRLSEGLLVLPSKFYSMDSELETAFFDLIPDFGNKILSPQGLSHNIEARLKKRLKEKISNPQMPITKFQIAEMTLRYLIREKRIQNQTDLDQNKNINDFMQKYSPTIDFHLLYTATFPGSAEFAENGLEDEIEEIPEMNDERPGPYLVNDTDWYSTIGLRCHPFPSEDGLFRINSEDYEQIVLKTALYQQYIELLEQSPEEFLNQSTIIYGDFGCGKTTFFDYLNYQLLMKKILPIRIILNAKPSLNALEQAFNEALCYELSNDISKFSTNPRSQIKICSQFEILSLFETIRDQRQQIGFVIFLDGLHKSQEQSNIALSFLVELQNFLEFYRRKNIPLSIFIAGSNEWQSRIARDKSFSGSIYRLEKMAEINAQQAYDMIYQRFNVFGTHPGQKFFKYSEIELLINLLTKSLATDVTFRVVIKGFLNHGFLFKNRIKFNLNIEEDVLSSIYRSLQNNRIVSNSFREIKDECGENRTAFEGYLRVISVVYDLGYIFPDHPFFQKYQRLLNYLEKKNILIQSTRRIKENEKAIVLNDDFFNLFKDIENKVKFRPVHYLQQIFQPQNNLNPENPPYESILQTLKRFLDANPPYRPQINTLITLINEKYFPLIKKIEMTPQFTISQSQFDEMITIIEAILRLIFDLAQEPIKSLNRTDLFSIFRYSWLDNRFLTQFFNWSDRWNQQNSKKSDNQKFLTIFIECVEAMVFKYGKHMLYNNFLIIGSERLNDEDKRQLNQARALYSESEFQKAIEEFHDYFEEKLRIFLFQILFLKYGNLWQTRIPPQTMGLIKMIREKEKLRYATALSQDENVFYLLSRGGYSYVIDDNFLWENCFRFIFGDSYRLSIRQVLESISNIGHLPKHNRKEDEIGKIATLFQQNVKFLKEILEKMNQGYIKLLDKDNISVVTPQIWLTFLHGKDTAELSPIEIDAEKIVRFQEIVTKIDKLRIDITNCTQITEIFGFDFRIFYGLLAKLIHAGKIGILNLNGTIISINNNQ